MILNSGFSQADLRKHLRALRLAISLENQYLHSTQAVDSFLQQAWDFTKVGVYLSDDGELATQLLIEKLWAAGKQVFLPLVGEDGSLVFASYDKTTPLVENKFGILEPDLSLDTAQVGVVAPLDLDLVLVPLVGFDASGNRLGRGGGFYDKSFAGRGAKPLLIGWAHACQEVDRLEVNSWDVPLDALITEKQVFLF